MKAKLLKKIRRKFSYEYNAAGGIDVINIKTKEKNHYPSILVFVSHCAYKFIGLISGADYEIKIIDRKRDREYYIALISK